jgi:hypothetical protein
MNQVNEINYDVSIVAKSSYIVSEDKDFRVLTKIDFPKVNLWRLNDFDI